MPNHSSSPKSTIQQASAPAAAPDVVTLFSNTACEGCALRNATDNEVHAICPSNMLKALNDSQEVARAELQKPDLPPAARAHMEGILGLDLNREQDAERVRASIRRRMATAAITAVTPA